MGKRGRTLREIISNGLSFSLHSGARPGHFTTMLVPAWGKNTAILWIKPGGGHGNPLQCSCLESPHGQRSLASYGLRGHKELDMTERLSTAQAQFSFERLSLVSYQKHGPPFPGSSVPSLGSQVLGISICSSDSLEF